MGITQADAARRCGLEPRHLSHLETGAKKSAWVAHIVAFAKQFRKDPEWLLIQMNEWWEKCPTRKGS